MAHNPSEGVSVRVLGAGVYLTKLHSMFLPRQQLGKLRLKHTELVSPRVAQDPEVESAFHLMIPPGGAQRFKAANVAFNVVGL